MQPLIPRAVTPAAVPKPQLVAGLADVQKMLLDELHSCAQLKTGALQCWGIEAYQLPDPIESPEPDPDAPPDPDAEDPVAERDKIASTPGTSWLQVGVQSSG